MFKPHPSIYLLQTLFSPSPSLHSLTLFPHPSSLPPPVPPFTLARSFLPASTNQIISGSYPRATDSAPTNPPPPLPPNGTVLPSFLHPSLSRGPSPSLAPALPPQSERFNYVAALERKDANVSVDGVNKQTIQTVNVTARVFLYFP